MFSGFLSIVSLCGAVTCTILALVLTVGLANRRQRWAAGSHTDSATSRDDTVQRIARILSAERGGVITADAKRHNSPLAMQELRISLEIAKGLQVICEASPEVAAHDSNLALFARLHEVTGSTDFRFLCTRLAAALSNRDPRYASLAVGLEHGDLSWNSFVAELRGVPI